MTKEAVNPNPDKINWPDHITDEQFGKMRDLCAVKNTRVVVADELESEGLAMRGAVEQKLGTRDHPRWQMLDVYARVGQIIRQADDNLGVWRREVEKGRLTPADIAKQKYLYSLTKDPKGIELLEMLLERGRAGEFSLSETAGFEAGVQRYRQLYEALTLAGVSPRELEDRFYPPIVGGARPLLHRREPIPREGEYTVVEEIIKDGVMVDERGNYHVFWGKSHYYFQDLQAVLYNHDRVIETLQGTLITIQNDAQRVLEIEGEIPQVAGFAHRLSFISAGLRNVSLQTPQTRRQLLGELSRLKDEVGRVRNELKRQGKDKILAALAAEKPEVAGQRSQEASKDFLERAFDASAKLEGAVKREEILLKKRDKWEGRIEDGFRIMGAYLLGLEERKEPTFRWLRSMNLQITSGRKTILSDLQAISGQPYKRRIEQPEIKRLGELPDAVGRGDFLTTKKILRDAILMLERVVKEKAERERAAKSVS